MDCYYSLEEPDHAFACWILVAGQPETMELRDRLVCSECLQVIMQSHSLGDGPSWEAFPFTQYAVEKLGK